MIEQSDQEYIDACNAVIIKVRQENRAALRAAEARGLQSQYVDSDEDEEEVEVEVNSESADTDVSGQGW